MKIFLFLFLTLLSTYSYSGVIISMDDSTKTIQKKASVSFYDTSAIFQESWIINQTFVYADKSFKAGKKLNFTDSIHSYSFPVEKPTTSKFGRRRHSYHKGIDIPLHTGDPVVAVFDGKVRYATYNSGGFGKLVIIRHVNGLETFYAHLSRIKVKPNQIVKAGDVIGLGGSTGRSQSPHLHFEVRYKDKEINPENLFDLEHYCLKNETAMIGELMLKNSHHHVNTVDYSSLAKGDVYSIQAGDTLTKIAAQSGKTVNELCAMNGLTRNSVLQIGQKIRIN